MVVNSETASSQSATPVVVRGSAPNGTFQIPDDGLRLDSDDTFLSRFKSAIRLRTYPSLSATTTKSDFDGNDPVITSESTYHPSSPSKRCLSGTPVSIPGSPSSPQASTDPISTSSKSHSNCASSTQTCMPNDSYTGCTDHSHLGPPEGEVGLTRNSNHISAEQAADEVEDTLIQVNPDGESLLNSNRLSYPILRFCSATGLLDQPLLDKLGLPIGFVWTPFGHLSDVPHITNQPLACTTCGAFLANANGGEAVLQGATSWTCSFCDRDNNDASSLSSRIMTTPHIPQLSCDVFTSTQHATNLSSPSPHRPAVVLIVDENFSDTATKFLSAAVTAVHNLAVSRSHRFVFLTIGAGCSAVPNGVLQSVTAPIVEALSPSRVATMSPAEKSRYIFDGSTSISNSFSSQDDLSSLFENIVTPRLSPFGRDEWHQCGSMSTALSFDVKSSFPNPSLGRQRRLDEAISVAFELLTGTCDLGNSRIISLISGPPTLGKKTENANSVDGDSSGAVHKHSLAKVYEKIGTKAHELQLCLDFLVFEEGDGFAAKVLLGAARRSKGGTIHCAAHSFASPKMIADAAVYLASRSTIGGVVSMRVSSPFVIARVIGPGFPTATPHTYSVSSADSSVGFTVVLRGLSDDKSTSQEGEVSKACRIKNHHAVIQLTAASGGICRVVTVRIPVVRSMEVFMSSLDVEVSSVVLGKACVVSGGGVMNPKVVAASVDATVRQLVENGGQSATGVIRLLYDLRFGPLVEPHFHTDQSVMLRSLFLRAESALAALLMSPRLFTNAVTDGNTGMMTEVPLERKFVNGSSVAVLDTGLNVFVFAGKNSQPGAVEAITESARNVVAQRALPCQLWELSQNSAAESILTTYLWNENNTARNSFPISEGQTKDHSGNKGFTEYLRLLSPEAKLWRVLQSHG